MQKSYFTGKSKGYLIRIFLLIFLFYIGVSEISYSQNNDTINYLPLNCGDWYDYYKIEYPDWVTINSEQIRAGAFCFRSLVKDTVILNNKKYFVITNFIWKYEGDTVRIDSAGNVLFRYYGKDNILLKFSGKEYESWNVTHEYRFGIGRKNDTLKLPLGIFHKCIKIFTGANWPFIYFTSNFGRIAEFNDYGSYVLGKAKIKGLEYNFLTSVKGNEEINKNREMILLNNYPNPFNSSTVINYTIGSNGSAQYYVKLIIYDILGRELKTPVDETKNAGEYSITWDGKDKNGIRMPTGTYFYKLLANNKVKTGDMILLK
jgi:hypothetical protein